MALPGDSYVVNFVPWYMITPQEESRPANTQNNSPPEIQGIWAIIFGIVELVVQENRSFPKKTYVGVARLEVGSGHLNGFRIHGLELVSPGGFLRDYMALTGLMVHIPYWYFSRIWYTWYMAPISRFIWSLRFLCIVQGLEQALQKICRTSNKSRLDPIYIITWP